jgi:hypothetical protein
MTRQRKGRQRGSVVCVDNAGFEEALDKGKTYEVLPETRNATGELVRVIDESGEDYLYPRSMFVPVEPGTAAAVALANAG